MTHPQPCHVPRYQRPAHTGGWLFGAIRAFCGECGAALTYLSDAEPGFLDVMTVTLDDPDAYPPGDHVWVSEKLAWDVITDALPAHPRGR